MAKLVAQLASTAGLWVRIQIVLKQQFCYRSKGITNSQKDRKDDPQTLKKLKQMISSWCIALSLYCCFECIFLQHIAIASLLQMNPDVYSIFILKYNIQNNKRYCFLSTNKKYFVNTLDGLMFFLHLPQRLLIWTDNLCAEVHILYSIN